MVKEVYKKLDDKPLIENEKTLQRYRNKWNKILLRSRYKQMELKFKDWGQ